MCFVHFTLLTGIWLERTHEEKTLIYRKALEHQCFIWAEFVSVVDSILPKPILKANCGHHSNLVLSHTCMKLPLFTVCTVNEFVCNEGDFVRLTVPYKRLHGFFFQTYRVVYNAPNIRNKKLFFFTFFAKNAWNSKAWPYGSHKLNILSVSYHKYMACGNQIAELEKVHKCPNADFC